MILNLCLSILLPVLTLRVILADNGLQTSDQKDPELSDMKGSLSVVDEAGNPGDSFLSNKRATGFMPMRGRKDYLEEKRMNFMPMRGKKELLSESEDPLAEKRMNFMPMRGRKNGFPELYENYVLNPMDYDGDAMMSKRASGFVPMRGKKEEDKRAGFHALRGKKGGPAELFRTSFGSNRNWDGRAPAFEPKRANAFFGMREKDRPRSRCSSTGSTNINSVQMLSTSPLISETVSKDKLPPKVFANWNKLRISTVDRHKRVCNADKTYESEKWSRKKKLKDINRVEKILDSAGINFKCTIVNNESCLDDTKQMLVLDSSDDDIQFKTPPATKKVWKKKKNELPGSKFEKKSMTPVSSPKKRKPVEVVTLHPQCVGRRHPTKLCLNLPKFRLLRAAARAI